MKQFKVISQLRLIDGELMCKKPSGRSYQKAHFKQGDLDGACGAYAVAMVLNILGVFEAEEICSNNTIDKRTSEWKLISSLNEEGLYRDGLTSLKIKEKLFTNYKRHVDVNILNKNSSEDIIEATKIQIEENIPVIINLEFNKHDGHWVVAVGYILDGKGNLSDFLILDPGSNSPTYALWNGILDLHKEPRKVYGYKYNSDYNTYVDIPEIIIISKKDK